MDKSRTHLVVPTSLVEEIDKIVGKRARSRFFVEAAARELLRRRQLRALKRTAGAWKDEDHPELKNGSRVWIDKLRLADEKRLQKLFSR